MNQVVSSVFLAHSSTLEVDATYFYETSVYFQGSTRRYIPESRTHNLSSLKHVQFEVFMCRSLSLLLTFITLFFLSIIYFFIRCLYGGMKRNMKREYNDLWAIYRAVDTSYFGGRRSDMHH
jgi:hypothetical protein